MSEQEPYMMSEESEERAWFEQVGRSVYSKAVRKAQEMVARGDITLGPDPTPVPVEVGEEKFILGIRQGNPDAAEGVVVTTGPITICCRCNGSPILICIGKCCAQMEM